MEALERLQQRFAKMLPGFKTISYNEKLNKPGFIFPLKGKGKPDRCLSNYEKNRQVRQSEPFSQSGNVKYLRA